MKALVDKEKKKSRNERNKIGIIIERSSKGTYLNHFKKFGQVMKENEKKTNCIYSLNDKFTCEPVEHSVQSWGPKKKKKKKTYKMSAHTKRIVCGRWNEPDITKIKAEY